MRTILYITMIGSIMAVHPLHAMTKKNKSKEDSVQVLRKPFFKDTKEESVRMQIEQMSDKQLMLLIDRLFETSDVPSGLWSRVIMETAKRNLNKNIQKHHFNQDAPGLTKSDLYIEKIVADSLTTTTDYDALASYPASEYYNEWEEEPTLFKDQFKSDTSYTLELESPEFGCFKMPAWGPLSSPFGWRYKRYHKGTDIQLRKGDTITCAFDGMVRYAHKQGGYGNVVIVRHYNGLETVYAHLSKIKVKEGDVVGAGDLIGFAGSTGHSTGPHLHFEVRFLGLPVNPQYFISYDYGHPMFNTVTFTKNRNGLLSAFNPQNEFHTVVKGETFAGIANHYGTTTIKLRALNDMTPRQRVRLKQGQVLRVRVIDNLSSISAR